MRHKGWRIKRVNWTFIFTAITFVRWCHERSGSELQDDTRERDNLAYLAHLVTQCDLSRIFRSELEMKIRSLLAEQHTYAQSANNSQSPKQQMKLKITRVNGGMANAQFSLFRSKRQKKVIEKKTRWKCVSSVWPMNAYLDCEFRYKWFFRLDLSDLFRTETSVLRKTKLIYPLCGW